MIEKLSERVKTPSPEDKIEFFSDGNNDYTSVLPKYFAEPRMNYGQLIKIREGGRVVDKKRRVIYGEPNPENIETTDIENFNGILRERVGRLVRKTKCFSKLRPRLECSIELFQFYWNFMNEFKKGKSPAMMEGLTDHVWTWHEFLTWHPSA